MSAPPETSSIRTCGVCGKELIPSPLGWQCLRCTFALAAVEDEGEAQIADLFPELRLEGKIAQGGFGTIFRAEHRRMQRPVALKYLDTHLSRSPEAVTLFEREMIHVGALDHPGIVRAYDAGERDGHWFILMEFIEGEDCGALARRHGTLPVAESCEIIRQAALALHHAHTQGLVHRDVKPGNLMLMRAAPSAVKVLDFGLASLMVAPLFGPASESSDHFLGTLEYVAPEQIETPDRVDARADVYGLGATLRRLLTGQPLRAGAGEHSLFLRMKAITNEAPPPIASVRSGLPAELARLCDRLVALDREIRPANAGEAALLLEPWCAGAELTRLFAAGPLVEKAIIRPRRPRRRLWRGVAVAVAAGLLAASASFFPEWRKPLPAFAAPATSGRPVFSPALIAERLLEPADVPLFVSDGWETEREFSDANQLNCARFLSDGGLIVRRNEREICRFRTDGKLEHFIDPEFGDVTFIGAAPDTGYLIWTQHDQRLGLGRARPDGKLLPSLAYDFTPEQTAAQKTWRQAFLKSGTPSAPVGYPWGFAFIRNGEVPADTGLRSGDVIMADEGGKDLAPTIESQPGLWRCRFDDDQPATRLGGEDKSVLGYPCDIAASRHGVWLLCRSEYLPSGPVSTADRRRRVVRWDIQGFHPCTLDLPMHDPTGLAADPSSPDLYAIEGGRIPSVTRLLQHLLRLRSTGPDTYAVEVIAEGFGRLSPCGLAMSADGQRLLLTDSGNHVVLVLKKRPPASLGTGK